MDAEGKVERPVAYPMVACRIPEHPPAPGFAVCWHVLEGDPVFLEYPPRDGDLGLLECESCFREDMEAVKDNFSTICEHCARALKLLKAEVVH